MAGGEEGRGTGEGRDVPTIRSVALAVESPERPGEVLAVRRPDDDPDLPGIWGLPAASRREGESWEEAARRAGREKLGVEVGELDLLGEEAAAREGYDLVLRLYATRIEEGEPEVPRPHPGVTQYADLRRAPGEILLPGAEAGSLCCRLYLRARRGAGG